MAAATPHSTIDPRRRNVAFLVAACFFMEIFDGTIVITAIPSISESLDARANATALIITAYLVTVAMLIPLSGWMTLRFGYRRVFLSAIVIFTLASAGCATSSSLLELVGLRVLQGVGGAMMVPVGRMVVFEAAQAPQVMRLTSFIVWPALLAPVFAPLAGGVITTYAGWRWLFLINIPLGVAAFLFAWRLIEGRASDAPPRLDRLGGLLTCGGIGGLVYTAHLASDENPAWGIAAVLGVASIAVLAVAALHLLRTDEPILDLRTLRIPTFGLAMAGTAPLWLVIGAIPFLLPLLFQTVFDWSPIKSGAVVLFVFAGNILIKPATTLLYTRFGFRNVLLAMSVLLAATSAGCGLLTADTPLAVIIPLVLVSGAARSIAMTGYSTLSLADVPAGRMRSVNALISTSQQLVNGLAVVVATLALRAGALIGDLLPGADEARASYTVAFMVLAAFALGGAYLAWRLPVSAGQQLIARPQAA